MKNVINKAVLLAGGAVAGICNGLFGSGGGMIAVPVLERFARTETKNAHATAIGVILPFSVISIFKYATFSKVDFKTLWVVCVGGVIGSFIGAKLLKKFSGVTVRRIFACVIIIAAVRMVIL